MKAEAGHSAAAGSTIAAPVVRGRIGPLQCAALTAVIVSCIAALALMTGVLPVSNTPTARESAAPSRPVPAAPAIISPPVVVPVPADGGAPAHRVPRSDAGLLAQEPPVATPVASMPAPHVAGEQPAAAAVATVATVATVAAAAASMQPNQTPVARAPEGPRVHGRRHRVRLAQRKQRTHAAGKTRAEVIAELMRAKRDGSYSANSEAYR